MLVIPHTLVPCTLLPFCMSNSCRSDFRFAVLSRILNEEPAEVESNVRQVKFRLLADSPYCQFEDRTFRESKGSTAAYIIAFEEKLSDLLKFEEQQKLEGQQQQQQHQKQQQQQQQLRMKQQQQQQQLQYMQNSQHMSQQYAQLDRSGGQSHLRQSIPGPLRRGELQNSLQMQQQRLGPSQLRHSANMTSGFMPYTVSIPSSISWFRPHDGVSVSNQLVQFVLSTVESSLICLKMPNTARTDRFRAQQQLMMQQQQPQRSNFNNSNAGYVNRGIGSLPQHVTTLFALWVDTYSSALIRGQSNCARLWMVVEHI